MSSNDIKLLSLEEGTKESSFYNATDTDAFLGEQPDKPKDVKMVDGDRFSGLTRDELEQFASDPKWVKIRWVLFIILIVGWAAMLIGAVIIVVVQPKCPPTPSLEWYQDEVSHRLDPTRFQDSNGDGVGDIKG